MIQRLDYGGSCRRLYELGWAHCEPPPPIPDHKPRYDDEEPLGINFFRTSVEGDFSGLTLPRTFFGLSVINGASFRNTDLTESTLCWNDFADCDFSDSVLADCDLRASRFEHVSFVRADLRRADLRRSGFLNCVFDGASMEGATLARLQKVELSLSASQVAEIGWTDDEGDEPDGA